eukprot:g19716.t1
MDHERSNCRQTRGPSWKLTSAQIPKRLQQLQQFGYTVVIFSNQQGPGRQTSSERMQLEVAKLLSNFEDFYDFVRVDLQIFVSTARGDIGDPFRKPNTGGVRKRKRIILESTPAKRRRPLCGEVALTNW